MSDYRLYLLDATGHIRDFAEYVACSDSEALKQAEQLRATGPAELWQRARRLKVFADDTAE
ncbi:hypothetical protein [Phenylobacterium sp.]|jgi:hypothetical protein|uniref:hypothetical protein n=1 Tax=Phenylobacterium sp. TaxID=1871053 RepID=UPI002F4243B0